MPIFELQHPDGRSLQIEAPDLETATASMGQMKPTGSLGTVNAFSGGAIEGIPIVGPLIKEGAEKVAAGIRSRLYGTPYEDELKTVQTYASAAAKEHPITSTVGELVGGIGATGGLATTATGAKLLGLTGRTLPQMIARGAASGSAISAADAIARGQDAVGGGVVGGVVGSVAPIAGRAIGKVFGSTTATGIDDLALGWARRAAKADGLSDAQIAAKFSELGPDAFLAEYGPNLRGLAGAIASQPGAGKAAIFEGLQTRAGAARERIEQAVTDTMGRRENLATLTREGIEQRKTAADPLYDAWRTVKVHPTDEIKNLIPILEQDGLFATARHLMMIEGKPTNINFFTTGDRKSWPTPEAYDYVKQAIDGKISDALQAGNRNVARIYGGLKTRLDNAIANSNPDAAEVWKQAREAWANPTALMRAREEGQNVWNPNTRRDDLLYQLTDYSTPERAAFKEGARDALAELMDRSVRGDTNVRNMLLAPANQEKMYYLAQNKNVNVQNLLSKLERENVFAETQRRVLQSSETEPRRAMGEMVKPDPQQTAIARLRSLNIEQPLSLIPKVIQDRATQQQSAQFEAARNLLARALMYRGNQATDFLRSLSQGGRPLPQRQISSLAQILASPNPDAALAAIAGRGSLPAASQ